MKKRPSRAKSDDRALANVLSAAHSDAKRIGEVALAMVGECPQAQRFRIWRDLVLYLDYTYWVFLPATTRAPKPKRRRLVSKKRPKGR